jgi:Tfp pilus assembly protein PilN
MIRVNLAGANKKKVTATRVKEKGGPVSFLPILLVAIIIGTGLAGYWWYSTLSSKVEGLNTNIAQAEAQKARLQKVIDANRVYESRKKLIENRIKVIDGLRKNQVSPVVSLDILGEALDRTQWVWLSSLDQNNANFNMSGTATSLDAIADLYSNLESTGYFRNINLSNAQEKDAQGNYAFSMTCEFAPPVKPQDAQPAAGKGN